MKCLARRIADGKVLHLIGMWPRSPALEVDKRGRKKLTGGKKAKRGTPQGGVISPLLANSYMNRYIKTFRRCGLDKKYGAVLVTYADDLVVPCRHKPEQVLEITRRWMEQMGLELNQENTAIRDAVEKYFDFLGYTFGPLYLPPGEIRYLRAMPSKKATKRIRENVRGLLCRGNTPIPGR